MKTKKLLALGLLSAMAVTSLAGTNVSAATFEGTGRTDVTYKPGSSTGGDGNGNVSDWTVDYPVKIVLDDGTDSKANARKIKFSIRNTTGGGEYSGAKTVTASLEKHGEADGDEIKLKADGGTGAVQDKVKMKLEKTSGQSTTITPSKTSSVTIGTLNSTTKTFSLDAYLSERSGAKTDQTYGTTLKWNFKSIN
ncbi:hypothetical protein [Massilimicrobiota timonensis]|uniref:hypothetical protein n=1 Tax=Massilimicrobiota timonensis TaxID=1776392 RepID=UPI00101C4B10|nr:hypothetical protein [Massilimicrobiota timonensis]